jgi:hypothetical protein
MVGMWFCGHLCILHDLFREGLNLISLKWDLRDVSMRLTATQLHPHIRHIHYSEGVERRSAWSYCILWRDVSHSLLMNRVAPGGRCGCPVQGR